MKETVSVIIPVYNREKYIEECVSSVLEQYYQRFEIIIVDDGSTDRTVELCTRLTEKDARIRFFAVEHLGVSAARNKAIEEAQGEYLFFVDSDDVIHPAVLGGLVAAMKENEVSIAAVKGKDVPDSVWEESILKEILGCPDLGGATVRTNASMIETFFTRNRGLGRMGGVMMRKSYVAQTRFRTDLRLGEDVWFIYENLIKGTNVAILEREGYYWRFHSEKSSLDITYAGFLARNSCGELLRKSEEKYGRIEHVKAEKAKVVQNYISTQCRNKLYGEDGKKMRVFMKQHKKELLASADSETKRLYYISVYTPWLYFPLHIWNLKRKSKKHRKNG